MVVLVLFKVQITNMEVLALRQGFSSYLMCASRICIRSNDFTGLMRHFLEAFFIDTARHFGCACAHQSANINLM
jgi:hypothetical protein